MSNEREAGWIGVAVDALVAPNGDIRLDMCERVVMWLRKGHDVRLVAPLDAISLQVLKDWFFTQYAVADLRVATEIDREMAELWSPRARQIEPDGRIAELPRIWYSPIAEFLSRTAHVVDGTDPGGDQTMCMVITAMEGHTEVYMTDNLRRSELLAHGVLQAGRMEIEGNPERFYVRVGSEDDGHTD